MKLNLLISSLALLCSISVINHAKADLSNFKTGPVFSEYGKHHPVDISKFNQNQRFKVAFDVAAKADAGEINRRFDSLARFINMHVANGVALENIELALVVHGGASKDLLSNAAYQAEFAKQNANEALLKALMDKGVKVLLCGQSAAAHGIQVNQLINGVKVPLSAMTAHAQLQSLGYTVNPF